MIATWFHHLPVYIQFILAMLTMDWLGFQCWYAQRILCAEGAAGAEGDTRGECAMSGTDTAVSELPSVTTQTTPAPEGTAPMLSQGKWAGIIAIMAMSTVCLVVLGGAGAMIYRVVIDGNSPLTADISGKLTMIVMLGVPALVVALFGSNSLIAKLMEKLL